MVERAELRTRRRAEFAAHQAARTAAAEARVAEDAAKIKAVKRAVLQAKRDARRAELVAAEDRAHGLELAAIKSDLARMHATRATLLFFGWAPWRRLLEHSQIRARAMTAHVAVRTLRRLLRHWVQGVQEAQQRKKDKADRHHTKHLLRSLLRQWCTCVRCYGDHSGFCMPLVASRGTYDVRAWRRWVRACYSSTAGRCG
jgi:hypothetical protein